MRPFAYRAVNTPSQAVAAAAAGDAAFLAGGTTLLDLMKLDVMAPRMLIDLGGLHSGANAVSQTPSGVRLPASARMADVAEDATIKRDFPVIAQSLSLAASAQLRNMATLGGNVLQRTRCSYFRDVAFSACNKRAPGSGCAALDGVNRKHAVLGTSANCIATYPGDFAQALMALDASVELLGPDGARTLAFASLHREPGDAPDKETSLAPGELITAFTVPTAPWTRRSLFLKIRDRQSYEFALASAAVALDIDGNVVRHAGIALGGIATRPWRAREAEQALIGQAVTQSTAEAAAGAALASAKPRGGNAYKIELAKRTLTRALLQAAQMEV